MAPRFWTNTSQHSGCNTHITNESSDALQFFIRSHNTATKSSLHSRPSSPCRLR